MSYDGDLDAAIAASIAESLVLQERRQKAAQEAEDAALALSLSRGATPAESKRGSTHGNSNDMKDRRAQELEDAALAYKLSTGDQPSSYKDTSDSERDEAYARSLMAEEQRKTQAPGRGGRGRGDDQEDKDYALALQLQDEQGNSTHNQPPSSLSPPRGGRGLFDRFVNALSGRNGDNNSYGNGDGCCVCGNTMMHRRVKARGLSYCSTCFACKRCHTVLTGQFYYDDAKDPGGIYCQPW